MRQRLKQLYFCFLASKIPDLRWFTISIPIFWFKTVSKIKDKNDLKIHISSFIIIFRMELTYLQH
jgi:hypothetical protein